MHQSKGCVGHSKHRKAFGDGRKQKSPRLRLMLRIEAERAPGRKARKNPTMVETLKDLFHGRKPI